MSSEAAAAGSGQAPTAEDRAYFVITGLPQPIKLKLSMKSALKNLFGHVPYTHANITPEFFWKDLKLDPNCCPLDYGMLSGPNHVQNVEVRMPPRASSQLSDAAAARVYSTLQPMALLGALTQAPPPVPKAASPQRSTSHIGATERLIEELQYAVKVHSESALRLNEQLLTARKDLSEVTEVMSKENRKLTEQVLDLEEQVRIKEQLRQDQVQQNLSTIHQHFSAIEQEREARREEVISLRKLIEALTLEKDSFAQRNEELSNTLHQRDEEWAADLEHFTDQMKRAQTNTLHLESRIAELCSVQSENSRVHAENKALSEIAEREPKLLDELQRLQGLSEQLQSHLMTANATIMNLQNAVAKKDEELSLEQAEHREDVKNLQAQLESQGNLLSESLQKNVARPSEAQLHAKIREVVAQNQRLVQLIKQPSSAVMQRSISPTLPPGISAAGGYNTRSSSSPLRGSSLEMGNSHWNERVQQVAQAERPVPQTAMERMYPPAEAIAEPGRTSTDVPSVPRRSQRIVQEEPKVVTRQELRRESVRQWADEALVEDSGRGRSAYDLATRRTSAVQPQQLQPDDERAIRSVQSIRAQSTEYDTQAMRSVPSVRQPSPAAVNPFSPNEREASPPLAKTAQSSGQYNYEPAQRVTRSKSVGDLRITAAQNNGSFLPGGRTVDNSGRPAIPRRPSMSRSPSQDAEVVAAPVVVERAAPQFQEQQQVPSRRTSVRQLPSQALEPATQGGEEYPEAIAPSRNVDIGGMPDDSAPRVPMNRGVKSMRLPSPTAAGQPQQSLRGVRSAGDLRQPSPTQIQYPSNSMPTRGSGGGEEEAQEVIIQFEDSNGGDVVAPRSINTHILPPHESFVTQEDVLVHDEAPSESMIVERSSASGLSSAPQASKPELPRPEPEIHNEAIPFHSARSMFVNSQPLNGPAKPYVAPLRRTQSLGGSPDNQAQQQQLTVPQRVDPMVRPQTPPGGITPRSNPTPTGHSPRSPKIASVLLPTPRQPVSGEEATRDAPLDNPVADEVWQPVVLETKPVRYDATGAGAEVFGTVGALFEAAVTAGGARTALIFASDEASPTTNISWKKYGKASRSFARSVVGERYPCGSKIAILGDNCAEWALSYMGSLLAGCVPVGIYSGSSDAVKQIATVEARLLVVDSPKTLKQILLQKAQMPSVRRIVVCHGAIPPRVKETHRDFVLAFEEFLDRQAYATQEMMAERESIMNTEQLATICFTSGTTQHPKPVMLSHDNLLFSAWALANSWGVSLLAEGDGNVRLASHMPLADVTYIVVDIILPIVVITKLGVNVVTCFSRNTEDVVGLCRVAKPTIFLASPTVWKQMIAKAESEGIEDTQTPSYLGLENAVLKLWGGAPWNHGSCLSLCHRKRLDLFEFYSSTETSGIAITSSTRRNAFASCGVRLPGTELRFVPQEGRDEEGHGEMCFRGRNVAIGYYQCPSLTQQSFLDDGYYASGDVGQLDDGGMLYFDGKNTDFVINKEGQFVSLRKIEDGVLVTCPPLSHVVVFGANRKTNICLVALKTKHDPVTGKPTDELDAEAAAVNPAVRMVSEARVDGAFQHIIGKAISAYNSGTSCINPAHKVVRFAFFQSEPVYDSDELTINGKLRRFVLADKYSAVIEKLYEQQASRLHLKRQLSSSGGAEEHEQ